MSNTTVLGDGPPPVHLPLPGNDEAEKASIGTTNSGFQTPNDDLEKTPTTPEDVGQELSPTITTEYPRAFKLFFIIVALVLSIFLVALDMTIVATAIPKITDEFHSLDQVGWYGAAFFLTVGSFQSTWGKVYKYFALKASFLTAIAIFELGSLLCGVAQNSVTLIVGRAIAGRLSTLYSVASLMSCRSWWSRYRLGCIYNHCLRSTAVSKARLYWYPRSNIWVSFHSTIHVKNYAIALLSNQLADVMRIQKCQLYCKRS